MNLIDVISGRERGPVAWVVRTGLGCLTPLYRLAVRQRNRKFDRAAVQANQTLIHSVHVPVISVGNLTTGGTGKTPHVISIARKLRQLNKRVTLISRGYRAENTSAGVNDEALELEHRLPDVPHLQDPDRSRMADIAIEELEAEVLLLDDGFQHRQLNRDLDIVLIDATLPFGFDRLLPRGLLREPLANLDRADLVVVTRTDQVNDSELQSILETIRRYTSVPVLQSRMEMQQAISWSGDEIELDRLLEKPTLAFCGIGNPDNFFRQLENCGVPMADKLAFPDHHGYCRADLQKIAETANRAGAQQLLCTHKDLVKLCVDRIGNLPLAAVLINVQWLAGEAEMEAALRGVTGHSG